MISHYVYQGVFKAPQSCCDYLIEMLFDSGLNVLVLTRSLSVVFNDMFDFDLTENLGYWCKV